MDTMSRFSNTRERINFPERNLRDYLAMLLRGKWIIAGTFIVAMVVGFVYLVVKEPVYRATSRVLVNKRYYETSTPFHFEALRSGIVQNPVNNELEILKSRSLVDTVAARLLEEKYLDRASTTVLPILLPGPSDTLARGEYVPVGQVAGRLSQSIKFYPVPETDVIELTASSKSPKEASIIANVYAQAYAEYNLYTSRSRSRNLRNFLASQLGEKVEALEQAENSLKSYMQQRNVVSLDEEARKVINQLSQLEAARDAVDVEIQSLAKNISSYREQIAEQEKTVAAALQGASDPYIRLLQDQLARLEVQRDLTIAQNPGASSNAVYGATLRDIETQITALQEKLRNRTAEFLRNITPSQEGAYQGEEVSYLRQVKQKMISGEMEIQSLLAKRDALNAAIQDYERQFGRIPETSIQYAKLERSKMSKEKLYLMLEEKFNQARLSEQSEFGYVEVIDQAGPPTKPSLPKPVPTLALAAMFGLGLGVAISVIREVADKKVQTPEDVKKTGLTVLSTITRMRQEVRQLSHTGAGKSNGRAFKVPLVSLKNPFSSVAESYRLLRTGLESSDRRMGLRVVLVTSANSGEGKSTTASNLAVVVAQSGKKVLLIDADMRRPNIHSSFDLSQKPGLSELLVGVSRLEQVVQTSAIKNLWVISSGTVPANPAELLASDTIRENLDVMRSEFDFVILDSPPVLAVSDPSELAVHADGVFLVVSSGMTRIEELNHAVELLAKFHGKMPAVVLNNFDAHRAYGVTYGRRTYGHYAPTPGYHWDSQNGNARRSRSKSA